MPPTSFTRCLLLGLLVGGPIGVVPPASGQQPELSRHGPIPLQVCDTALAAQHLATIRALVRADTLAPWAHLDTAEVVVETDYSTCILAHRAMFEGARPALASPVAVVRLGELGYVVLGAGDTAGEWQMSYWFTRDWQRRGLALGI